MDTDRSHMSLTHYLGSNSLVSPGAVRGMEKGLPFDSCAPNPPISGQHATDYATLWETEYIVIQVGAINES